MPEYDAFGREVGEDTMSSWRSGSGALPAEPVPEPPAPAPAVSAAEAPQPAPRPAFRPPRRRRRVRLRWLLLPLAGWGALALFANVGFKAEDAIRDFKFPTVTPAVPELEGPAPTGLGAESLLRAEALRRSLTQLRGERIGRIQSLRIAPERIDATLLTRRGSLVSVQIRPGGGLRRLAESGSGFGAVGTIPYAAIVADAPQRLVRAAAERLGRPVSRIDYVLPTYTSGVLTWGAYFKGGAIFLADERGKITRRIS